MKISTVIPAAILAGGCWLSSLVAGAAEIHVAAGGNDANPGTKAAPFRTVQHAADVAQPGDVVTVHEGIYRERVNPPRGGKSDPNRITYQAAPGEKVVITGSEPVKGWEKVAGDTWKVTLPNAFFGKFNPLRREGPRRLVFAQRPQPPHAAASISTATG